ncbi:COMPASS (complex proteins associated with Set1p) component [Elasticomyces elasticus]|nr:COMPASS (complex proteins associated with Set1p) component [Elasticomyces elasticus]KAK3629655.1 COMPASS (complex proteins associated with Set1p) component [Elasticomyces elasticus]KAK4911254.1 COMPASS (complex proteins associated with Set1p) component [Elasticomyces elasticus]KAK5756302.1 COMPASS (complex proteins associated with Set1p) component [Elasticomyces elasticus]
MSFSLSSLLNPEPATAAQASPDAEQQRKSPLGYEQHYTYPTSTAVEAAEALATLAASEAPPPAQYYTSHAATSPIELPPPTPTTTRKPSSPTLEQYQTSSRSPEQQRRPSIISPALTLPPLQNFTSPSLEEQTQTPRAKPPHHQQQQQPTPESAYTHQQVPSAPMMQPRLPSRLDGTSSSPPPPTTSSPVNGRRSSVQPTEPKTVAALKQEHTVSTQSPLRESSVPMPSSEQSGPVVQVSNSDSANPVVKHKKTAPSKTKKGTASVSKRSAGGAGGGGGGPPSKKRKVEVKRSETPASRAVGKGSTTGGSSPVPSTQRSQSRSRSEEADGDEEAYGSSGNDEGGSGEGGDDSGDLYCICRKPDNGTFMIGCDGTCDDWYHGKCVGIEERDKNLIDKYLCPSCTKAGKGRTTWKRMCRREGCRLPAKVGKSKGGGDSSKYCSEECGVLFFREMVSRTRGREEVVKSRGGRRRGTGSVGGGVGQEDDLVGARGGVLAAGEVKALLNVSKTAEDFKKLGEGVLSPPATPDGKDGLPSSVGEGGEVFNEQDTAALAEVSKQKDAARKRHLVLKDRMKFVTMVKQAAGRMAAEKELKPKEFCGYDPRLEWTEEQFTLWRESAAGRQAFELETLAVENSGMKGEAMEGVDGGMGEDVGGVYAMLDVCGRKKCARHLEWAKLAVDDLRFEMGDNGNRMRGLDREESEIREGAAMRSKGGMGGVGEGTVEVHGLGITGLNGNANGEKSADIEMGGVVDEQKQYFGSAALQVEEHEVVDEGTTAPVLEAEDMETEQSAAPIMAPEAMMVVDAAAS